ncbi:MAG TPA: signal peptidase I [Hellea balneolensis]|uniref:Signal peptidase I n=1 Tax=Hellea balneolensis TaxID=287478 RepID=A0A7V5NXE1_9PROT|nr:signal peptidase I [Hellea balneolensis]
MHKVKSEAVAEPEVKKTGKQIIREEIGFWVGLLLFLGVFFNFVFGHFKIPSESMLPTLEVGDHLYVSKLTYGASRESLIWPFRKLPLPDGRVFGREFRRGDVIVFRNPRSGMIMIKRLIGIPGDIVETRHGQLYINNKLVKRTPVDEFSYRQHRGPVAHVTEYEQQLPGQKRPFHIFERGDAYPLDNTGPYAIPPGKLFFMGDNRDNSEDSRAPGGPGFVPETYVIGQAKMIMYSFHHCKKEKGLRCPKGRRFFIKL